MIPTSFDESNHVLDKPPGMTYEQCQALSVWQGESSDGVPLVVSAWKPTREELESIKRTGRVWLIVLGQTMPPVSLEGTSPFEPQKGENQPDSDEKDY